MKRLLFSGSLLAMALFAAIPLTPIRADEADPVRLALTPAAIATIDRDSRCADAKRAADAEIQPDATAKTALTALYALEKCASLTRAPGWEDYRDYLITAAAASAVELGRLTHDPAAYRRATADASLVTGFDAAGATHNLIPTTSRSGSTGYAAPVPPTDDTGQSSTGLVRYTPTTTAKADAGQPTTYGALATKIARVANTESQAIATASPRPVQQAH